MPELQTCLLDLLEGTGSEDLPVIVGGGFGIYLKYEHVMSKGIIRLRESTYYRSDFPLDRFTSVLTELFPA